MLEGLCDKVLTRRDHSVEAASPHPFGASVRVTVGGAVLERSVPDPSGEPASFPTAAALTRKFITLVEPVLGAQARPLADALLWLETFPSAARALELARPASR